MNNPNFKAIFYSWFSVAGITVTASETAVGDFVPENILDTDIDVKAKFNASSVTFTINLPDYYQFRSGGAFGHNLTPAGLITWEYFDGSTSLGTEEIDGQVPIYGPCEIDPFVHDSLGDPTGEDDQPYRQNSVKFYETTYFANKVELTLTDLNRSEIKLAYILGGLFFEPFIGADYGSSVNPVVAGTFSRSPNGVGQLYYWLDPITNNGNYILNSLDEGEANYLRRAVAYATGKKQAVFISFLADADTPEEQETEVLGVLQGIQGPTRTPGKYQTATLQLLELFRNVQ